MLNNPIFYIIIIICSVIGYFYIQNTDLFNIKLQKLFLNFRPTSLFSDIINPTKKNIVLHEVNF
jgi:hypothetical protein